MNESRLVRAEQDRERIPGDRDGVIRRMDVRGAEETRLKSGLCHIRRAVEWSLRGGRWNAGEARGEPDEENGVEIGEGRPCRG